MKTIEIVTLGPQGPQGEQGPSGSQGPQGNTGPSGSQGPQGLTGPAYSRQHDYQSPYDYNGKAISGSLTSENVWEITRLTIAENGTTTVASASNVAWDNRTSIPYT